MPKREIRVDFVADAAKFSSGVRAVTADLGVFEKRSDSAASKIKNAFSSILPALTAGGVALYFDNLSESVQQATADLDDLAKASRRLGLTSEELQRIRIQAEAAGVGTSTLDTAFQRFARRVGQGTLDKTFKELNISIRDSSGALKSNFNLWNEFGRKLSEVENENRQLALAMSAVDTEGVKLVELWRTSRDDIDAVNQKIDEYGLLYDKNILDKAEAYQTELGLIKRAQKALDVVTAAGLTEQSLQWEKLKLRISQAKFELLDYFGVFGVRSPTDEQLGFNLISEQKQLNAQLLELRRKRLDAETDAEKKAIDDRIRYAEQSLKRNTERRKALLDRLEGRATESKGSSGPAGIPTPDTLSKSTKSSTKYTPLKIPKQEKVVPLKDPVDDFVQSLYRYREELDLINPKLERLGVLFAEGAIPVEVYKEGIKRLGFETESVFDNLPEEVEKTNDAMQELGITFTSAFEDAIVEGKNLQDLLKGLEQDIIRIISRKLVTEPLGNAISGAFDSGGIFGDIFGGIFGGGKAAGGPVYAGTPYLVGENGPELYVPRSSGNIVPNGKFGGSVVVNINSIPPGGNPEAYRLSARQGALEGSRLLNRARSIS